ncbi:HNH endonuclease [Streptomyces thermolilacinus]
MASDRPLPEPDSEELRKVVRSTEGRAVYRVLYESRDAPLDMLQIRDHVQRITGSANEHTGRRLRELRAKLVIESERPASAKRPVYRLVGWHPDADNRSARRKLSASIEARVYATYGGRCAWCGRNSRDDGVKTVVDHVVPLDLGGPEEELSNLQILCREHNHAKQAMFAEHTADAEALRAAINQDEVHLRIGELLKAKLNQEVSVDLINLVAREENRGDPTRRLRELRALGWKIDSTRRKEDKRTLSFYTLRHWEPWPEGGPRAAINALEAARKRQRKSADGTPAESAAR